MAISDKVIDLVPVNKTKTIVFVVIMSILASVAILFSVLYVTKPNVQPLVVNAITSNKNIDSAVPSEGDEPCIVAIGRTYTYSVNISAPMENVDKSIKFVYPSQIMKGDVTIVTGPALDTASITFTIDNQNQDIIGQSYSITATSISTPNISSKMIFKIDQVHASSVEFDFASDELQLAKKPSGKPVISLSAIQRGKAIDSPSGVTYAQYSTNITSSIDPNKKIDSLLFKVLTEDKKEYEKGVTAPISITGQNPIFISTNAVGKCYLRVIANEYNTGEKVFDDLLINVLESWQIGKIEEIHFASEADKPKSQEELAELMKDKERFESIKLKSLETFVATISGANRDIDLTKHIFTVPYVSDLSLLKYTITDTNIVDVSYSSGKPLLRPKFGKVGATKLMVKDTNPDGLLAEKELDIKVFLPIESFTLTQGGQPINGNNNTVLDINDDIEQKYGLKYAVTPISGVEAKIDFMKTRLKFQAEYFDGSVWKKSDMVTPNGLDKDGIHITPSSLAIKDGSPIGELGFVIKKLDIKEHVKEVRVTLISEDQTSNYRYQVIFRITPKAVKLVWNDETTSGGNVTLYLKSKFNLRSCVKALTADNVVVDTRLTYTITSTDGNYITYGGDELVAQQLTVIGSPATVTITPADFVKPAESALKLKVTVIDPFVDYKLENSELEKGLTVNYTINNSSKDVSIPLHKITGYRNSNRTTPVGIPTKNIQVFIGDGSTTGLKPNFYESKAVGATTQFGKTQNGAFIPYFVVGNDIKIVKDLYWENINSFVVYYKVINSDGYELTPELVASKPYIPLTVNLIRNIDGYKVYDDKGVEIPKSASNVYPIDLGHNREYSLDIRRQVYHDNVLQEIDGSTDSEKQDLLVDLYFIDSDDSRKIIEPLGFNKVGIKSITSVSEQGIMLSVTAMHNKDSNIRLSVEVIKTTNTISQLDFVKLEDNGDYSVIATNNLHLGNHNYTALSTEETAMLREYEAIYPGETTFYVKAKYSKVDPTKRFDLPSFALSSGAVSCVSSMIKQGIGTENREDIFKFVVTVTPSKMTLNESYRVLGSQKEITSTISVYSFAKNITLARRNGSTQEPVNNNDTIALDIYGSANSEYADIEITYRSSIDTLASNYNNYKLNYSLSGDKIGFSSSLVGGNIRVQANHRSTNGATLTIEIIDTTRANKVIFTRNIKFTSEVFMKTLSLDTTSHNFVTTGSTTPNDKITYQFTPKINFGLEQSHDTSLIFYFSNADYSVTTAPNGCTLNVDELQISNNLTQNFNFFITMKSVNNPSLKVLITVTVTTSAEKLAFDESKVELDLRNGDTANLRAYTANMATPDTKDYTKVTYSSSNNAIATVDTNGFVTIINTSTGVVREVTITATSKNTAQTITKLIRVHTPVESIIIENLKPNMLRGAEQTILSSSVKYSGHGGLTPTCTKTTFNSSDPNIITITRDGASLDYTLKAVGGVGQAVITFYVCNDITGANVSYAVTITVTAPEFTLTSDKPSLDIIANKLDTITLNLAPKTLGITAQSMTDITYTSANPNLLLVSASGAVTINPAVNFDTKVTNTIITANFNFNGLPYSKEITILMPINLTIASVVIKENGANVDTIDVNSPAQRYVVEVTLSSVVPAFTNIINTISSGNGAITDNNVVVGNGIGKLGITSTATIYGATITKVKEINVINSSGISIASYVGGTPQSSINIDTEKADYACKIVVDMSNIASDIGAPTVRIFSSKDGIISFDPGTISSKIYTAKFTPQLRGIVAIHAVVKINNVEYYTDQINFEVQATEPNFGFNLASTAINPGGEIEIKTSQNSSFRGAVKFEYSIASGNDLAVYKTRGAPGNLTNHVVANFGTSGGGVVLQGIATVSSGAFAGLVQTFTQAITVNTVAQPTINISNSDTNPNPIDKLTFAPGESVTIGSSLDKGGDSTTTFGTINYTLLSGYELAKLEGNKLVAYHSSSGGTVKIRVTQEVLSGSHKGLILSAEKDFTVLAVTAPVLNIVSAKEVTSGESLALSASATKGNNDTVTTINLNNVAYTILAGNGSIVGSTYTPPKGLTSDTTVTIRLTAIVANGCFTGTKLVVDKNITVKGIPLGTLAMPADNSTLSGDSKAGIKATYTGSNTIDTITYSITTGSEFGYLEIVGDSVTFHANTQIATDKTVIITAKTTITTGTHSGRILTDDMTMTVTGVTKPIVTLSGNSTIKPGETSAISTSINAGAEFTTRYFIVSGSEFGSLSGASGASINFVAKYGIINNSVTVIGSEVTFTTGAYRGVTATPSNNITINITGEKLPTIAFSGDTTAITSGGTRALSATVTKDSLTTTGTITYTVLFGKGRINGASLTVDNTVEASSIVVRASVTITSGAHKDTTITADKTFAINAEAIPTLALGAIGAINSGATTTLTSTVGGNSTLKKDQYVINYRVVDGSEFATISSINSLTTKAGLTDNSKFFTVQARLTVIDTNHVLYGKIYLSDTSTKVYITGEEAITGAFKDGTNALSAIDSSSGATKTFTFVSNKNIDATSVKLSYVGNIGNATSSVSGKTITITFTANNQVVDTTGSIKVAFKVSGGLYAGTALSYELPVTVRLLPPPTITWGTFSKSVNSGSTLDVSSTLANTGSEANTIEYLVLSGSEYATISGTTLTAKSGLITLDNTVKLRAILTMKSGLYSGKVYMIDTTITVVGEALPTLNITNTDTNFTSGVSIFALATDKDSTEAVTFKVISGNATIGADKKIKAYYKKDTSIAIQASYTVKSGVHKDRIITAEKSFTVLAETAPTLTLSYANAINQFDTSTITANDGFTIDSAMLEGGLGSMTGSTYSADKSSNATVAYIFVTAFYTANDSAYKGDKFTAFAKITVTPIDTTLTIALDSQSGNDNIISKKYDSVIVNVSHNTETAFLTSISCNLTTDYTVSWTDKTAVIAYKGENIVSTTPTTVTITFTASHSKYPGVTFTGAFDIILQKASL